MPDVLERRRLCHECQAQRATWSITWEDPDEGEPITLDFCDDCAGTMTGDDHRERIWPDDTVATAGASVLP